MSGRRRKSKPWSSFDALEEWRGAEPGRRTEVHRTGVYTVRLYEGDQMREPCVSVIDLDYDVAVRRALEEHARREGRS